MQNGKLREIASVYTGRGLRDTKFGGPSAFVYLSGCYECLQKIPGFGAEPQYLM